MDMIEELAGLGSWEIDLTTDAVRWSRQQQRIHGVDDASTPATHTAFLAMVLPDDRQLVEDGMRALAGAEPLTIEFRVRRPDGAVRLLRARARLVSDADGRPTRVLGTSLDITDRQDALRLLREREEHVERLEEIAGTGAGRWTRHRAHHLVARAAARSTASRSTGPGSRRTSSSRWCTRTTGARIVEVMDAPGGEERRFDIEYRIVRPDGERASSRRSGSSSPGADGRLSADDRHLARRHASGTRRRRRCARARRATARSSSTRPTRCGCTTSTRRVLEVNDAACEMFGYTAEETKALGVAGLSAGVPPYRSRGASATSQRAAAGEPQRFEWLGRHRDGRAVWGEVRLRRVHDRRRGPHPRHRARHQRPQGRRGGAAGE